MNRAHPSGGQRRATRATGGLLAVATTASLLVLGAPTAGAEDAKYYTVVAHRGDQNEAPENTVSAFRRAIAKGADAIEMDVQFSSSGYPIIMHDLTFDRTTTNCKGAVLKKSRTQMKACDAGGWFGPTFKNEHIPTLEQALSSIASAKLTRVILHVKITPDAKRAKRIMDAVKKYNMAPRIIILASNTETFTRMKAAGFKTFAYIFNTLSGWNQKYQIMIPYDTVLDAAKIASVHARGGLVWPVESHPDSLKTLLTAAKVDGILANHLGSLLELLGSPPATIRASKEPKTSAGARRVQHDENFSDEMTKPKPKNR
jgi:glycerophosphoryl diester phosphodiesterase